MGLINKLFGKKQEKEIPPRPKWKPNLPIDIDLILERAKYYTGSKLQLAIFKNGTVAIFPEKVDNIEPGAKKALDEIYHFHVDFKPLPMDDGNYLIQYTQPAFTIVFKDEIENNWNYIDSNHLDGICTDEVLIDGEGQRNVFDRIGKICLFGRAKMFMDAQDPVVVRTFSPL